MSTNAVIHEDVSFPFMYYLRVTSAVATSPTVASDFAEILSMVSCGVWCGGYVRSITSIHTHAGLEERDCGRRDVPAAFLHENVAVSMSAAVCQTRETTSGACWKEFISYGMRRSLSPIMSNSTRRAACIRATADGPQNTSTDEDIDLRRTELTVILSVGE